jgi:hypothetical protein
MIDSDKIYRYEFSYMTQSTILLFKEAPSLEALSEVRKILDIVSDELIKEMLETE